MLQNFDYSFSIRFFIFKALKRFIGILMVSVYMFSFAELHNLLKIPVLLEHFKEHKQEDPSICFWDFIKLHYFDPIVVDDDYQRDQQLPFRDADCCIITSSSVFECLSFAMDIQAPTELQQEHHLYNEVNKPQYNSFDIFQPPRCA